MKTRVKVFTFVKNVFNYYDLIATNCKITELTVLKLIRCENRSFLNVPYKF